MRCSKLRLATAALTVLAIATAVPAQDGGEKPPAEQPSPFDAARKAYSKLLRATKRHNKLAEKARKDPSVRDLLPATARAHEKSLLRFQKAFAKTDWDAWDPEKDGELLAHGLVVVGSETYRDDPAAAVKAFEYLLAKLPKSDPAESAHWMLPYCLAGAGHFERAEAAAQEGVKHLSGRRQTHLLALDGEAAGARGDLDAARAAFERAAEAFERRRASGAAPAGPQMGEDEGDEDADGEADGEMDDLTAEERDEILQRSAAGMRTRAAALGKPAPPLPPATWIGNKPRKPSQAGKRAMLIVRVSSTRCWRCRAALVDLPRWQAEYGARGLDVVVLAGRSEAGYLVAGADYAFKGQGVRLEDDAQRVGHFTTYRERVGAEYPIGVLQEGADTYPSIGHAAWLVGPDGKVAALPGTFWYRRQQKPELYPGSRRVLQASIERVLPKAE